MTKNNIYDVLIVGGGIMGCSTAYHLVKKYNKIKLAVVETDPTYSKASTTLSMANARIQFGLKENILISKYTFDVLDHFEEDMTVEDVIPNIAFKREGNLFILNENNLKTAQKALDLQKSLHGNVKWLQPRQIKEKYNLYNIEDLSGGTFGSDDGHFDAFSFLMGFKKKAIQMGAQFIHDEVVELIASKGQIEGIRLSTGQLISSKYVVNCAGAWGTKIAQTAGVMLPVLPVMRQIFVLDTKVKPNGPLPLTVLPSGLYFRTETGGYILLGKSRDDDKVGFKFDWDRNRFMEQLWPELAEFVPAFDTLKLVRGWAGLYAVNTLDANAILGEWPDLKGFYLVNGFSGHGLQQGPAAGRYISELILGEKPAIDLSIFSPTRIIENKPLSENGIV